MAVVAPVHHVRAVGLGVGEHEEVVPHQLELQRGLVDRHRLERELLGLDDAAVVAGVRGLAGELVGERRRRPPGASSGDGSTSTAGLS